MPVISDLLALSVPPHTDISIDILITLPFVFLLQDLHTRTHPLAIWESHPGDAGTHHRLWYWLRQMAPSVELVTLAFTRYSVLEGSNSSRVTRCQDFLTHTCLNELIILRLCFGPLILETAAPCTEPPVFLFELFNGTDAYVAQDMGTVPSSHTGLH